MIIDFNHLTTSQQEQYNRNQEELIKEFNEVSDQILADMPDRIEDLVSNTVSRNVFFNSFLDGLKCLRFLETQEIGVDTTIIVYQKGLYKILKERYRDSIVVKQRQKQQCWKEWVRYIRAAYQFFLCYISKSRIRKQALIESKGSTLIDSYLHDNSIQQCKYIDRYYCDMLNYVEDKSKLFYLLLFLPKPSPKKARAVANGTSLNLIYFFDLLKFEDYLNALTLPFRRAKLKRVYKYHDFILNPLFEEFSHTQGIYFMYGILYYRFFKRAYEAGCDIKHVLDWFENQSYDKGLYYGLKKYYPQTTVNAYVGFITNPDQTPHNIPTKGEFDKGIAPLNIYLCNKWLSDYYSEQSMYAKCKPAAFFRAQKIWKVSRSDKAHDGFVVIVPLSLNNEESFFKVKKIKELIDGEESCVRFLLKPHPDTPKSFVDKLVMGYERIIKPVYGNIYDFLINADAMIATTSTTIFESVALGVPIISLIDETGRFTTQRPFGFDADMWYDVTDKIRFKGTIISIKEKGPVFFAKKGAVLKSLFFEPVTQESVNELLSIQ